VQLLNLLRGSVHHRRKQNGFKNRSRKEKPEFLKYTDLRDMSYMSVHVPSIIQFQNEYYLEFRSCIARRRCYIQGVLCTTQWWSELTFHVRDIRDWKSVRIIRLSLHWQGTPCIILKSEIIKIPYVTICLRNRM